MSQFYPEYNASANNARPCYSNLKCYGAYGKYRPIVPPTPVTAQPQLFNIMKPHNMPIHDYKQPQRSDKCIPYRKLNETCCEIRGKNA